MGNPIPTQVRSVDPYASYNSDVVNKLTRMISDGNNILLMPSAPTITQLSSSMIRVNAGKSIMDDVLIEIEDINMDLNDLDFYLNPSEGLWQGAGYYYVILHYEYQRTSPPPSASVRIIKPIDHGMFDDTKHLFLGVLNVNDPGGVETITEILDYDPGNPAIGREEGGANTGNYVATDANTTGLGAGLYNVGSGIDDRFNELWVRNLKVANIEYISGEGGDTGSYGTTTYDNTDEFGDLAERYTYDLNIPLETGTVVSISDGEYEIEQCNDELSIHTVGVISESPAYTMNNNLEDSAVVGIVGRVPVKVIGPIKKRDVIVSCGNGCAKATNNPTEYIFKIGIALESNSDESVKLIECSIK